jgi:hypothetical protein
MSVLTHSSVPVGAVILPRVGAPLYMDRDAARLD